MKACCPFCRTWNATYEQRAIPPAYRRPYRCSECDARLRVDGVYVCTHCGGVLVATVPRDRFLIHMARAVPRAILAAAVVTGIAATVRISISQEVLIYVAVGLMGLALFLWLFRQPLLRLLSLPTRKYARPAPASPVFACGACGKEASVD